MGLLWEILKRCTSSWPKVCVCVCVFKVGIVSVFVFCYVCVFSSVFVCVPLFMISAYVFALFVL